MAAEQCPNCQAYLAANQRYCLACGTRCGEPRLPFMDAVTFMNAMQATPEATVAAAPKPDQRRISPNVALFATIGVLLLAMGVGVLIGRLGNHSVASAPLAPQVIELGGSGTTGPKTAATEGGGAKIGGSSKKATPKALKKAANSGEGAEEVLKPASGVELPKANAKVGESCKEGSAGCTNGEFTGEFFGE